jgi:LPS sulfotransferase NodH
VPDEGWVDDGHSVIAQKKSNFTDRKLCMFSNEVGGTKIQSRTQSVISTRASLPMPIIVGSPRSGTTLLRFMIDSHPEMAIPPETGFFSAGIHFKGTQAEMREGFLQLVISYPPDAPAWNDFHIPVDEFRRCLEEIQPFTVQEGFRLFYKMYASRFGKSRWGDKTPMYCRSLLEIQKLLPEAHFIHLIRDGRDVAVSLREQWFSPGYDIVTQAKFWRENILHAHTQGSQCSHYLEIFYEELIRNPENVLRQICDFIKLDFHNSMLRYYDYAPQRLREQLERRQVNGGLLVSQEARYKQQINTTRPRDISKIGVWRTKLQPEEIRKFEKIAGDVLRSFGYSLAF